MLIWPFPLCLAAYVHACVRAYVYTHMDIRDAPKWKSLAETETEYTDTVGRKPKPNVAFAVFLLILL